MTNKMRSYLVNKYWELRGQDRKLFFDNIDNPKVVVDDIIMFVQKKHVQMAIAKKDGKKIIFILGSNQFVDWLYNLWFRFKRTPYQDTGTSRKIRAHTGFYKSYLLIRNSLHQVIRKDDDVIIMGQSLGAAIATFAALDVNYNFPEINIECFITGSPRCGNKRFVESYNKRVPKTERFVYGNDFVPALPFTLFGYRHVSKRIKLGPKRWHKLSIRDHMYMIKKKTVRNSYLKELG